MPHHVYRIQSDWYHAVRQRYGLPMDSRHLYTKTDWEFFAISIASEDTRAEILTSYAKWLNETSTDRPMTDLHDTEGDGVHFAFLTLGKACGGTAMEGLKLLHQQSDHGAKKIYEDATTEL